MSSKSQISLEFMIILGFLFFLLVVFLLFFIERQEDASDQGEFLAAKSECIRIASAVSSVYVSGDGTNIKTRTSYTISAWGDGLVRIGDIGCSYHADLSPRNISGNIAIKNNGGTVFLANY